jgi:hypothetical protein
MTIRNTIVILTLFGSHVASAAILDWLAQYRLGVDYTSSNSQVVMNYRVDQSVSGPSSCVVEGAQKMRCEASMYAGGANGFGLFLQRAFQRQGTWYFDADVGIGARYLEGKIKKAPSDVLPLRSASFSLGAAVIKPHLKLGYTPDGAFPDLFVSFGPALQIATGRVAINDETEAVVVGSSSGTGLRQLLYGYVELEAVFYRFGDGAFSLFSTRDFSDSKNGSKFFSKTVDGMDDIRASFHGSTGGAAFGFGLKLLMNLP